MPGIEDYGFTNTTADNLSLLPPSGQGAQFGADPYYSSMSSPQVDVPVDMAGLNAENSFDTGAMAESVSDYAPVFDFTKTLTDAMSAGGDAFEKAWSSISKGLFGEDVRDGESGERINKGLIGEAGSWVKENKELTQLLAAGVGGAIKSRSQERQLDEQRKWVSDQKEQDFKRQQEAAKYGRLGTGLLSVVQNQPKG